MDTAGTLLFFLNLFNYSKHVVCNRQVALILERIMGTRKGGISLENPKRLIGTWFSEKQVLPLLGK